MPINIKSQKDILATKFSVDLPANLNDVDQLMRLSKSTGTIFAIYSQGGMIGINVEQNTKVPDKVSGEVRNIVGVGTRELDGK